MRKDEGRMKEEEGRRKEGGRKEEGRRGWWYVHWVRRAAASVDRRNGAGDAQDSKANEAQGRVRKRQPPHKRARKIPVATRGREVERLREVERD